MRDKEKLLQRVKWIGIVLCAYIQIFSVSKITALNGDPAVFWGGQYFGYNMISVALFGLDIFLLKRWLHFDNRRLQGTSLVGGLLMSLLIVYGAYAHYTNNIFSSAAETFKQFGYIIGIAFLTIPLFAELFLVLEKAQSWYAKVQAGNTQNGKVQNGVEIVEGKKVRKINFSSKSYFLLSWAVIFVCYLPVFLANWPGNFIFDARYQMANVITGDHFTHHPLIHTLMMGKAYELGQRVGDVSFGFQFYTLAQMLILAAAFAYVLLYLYKKKTPRCMQIICFLWFALFPMHALFAITATKDVLCAAFFVFFLVFVIRLFVDKEFFKWYSYAGMLVSGTLLCLFRNNAMYAVMVAGVIICLLIKGLKKKGSVLIGLVAIYLCTTLVNEGLIAYTNAQDADKYRETLSVPLQCLARVASYRSEELAPELYAEICTYIREQDLAAYNPYLADPIKNNANEELLETGLGSFLKLWVKVGLQFPGEYMESIVTNTLGYWYPLNQGVYVANDISLHHTLIGVGEELEKKSFCGWAEEFYNSLFWTKTFYYVPLLGYAFRNAPYVWAVIILMLWSIYKKDKKTFQAGLLPLMYFGTCLLGPWAALRYIYCLVTALPLFIHMILSGKEESAGESLEEAWTAEPLSEETK